MTRPSFHLKHRDKRPIMCWFFVVHFLCVFTWKKTWKMLGHPTVQFIQFEIRHLFTGKKNFSNPHLKRSAPASMWIFLASKNGAPAQKKWQGCWLGYPMCMFFWGSNLWIFSRYGSASIRVSRWPWFTWKLWGKIKDEKWCQSSH